MGVKIYAFTLLLTINISALTQPVEKGPYTIHVLTDGVYHIEDANGSNPAGMHMDKDGKITGMNNCSDMYLLVGKKKALLIDLSNNIKWDTTATRTLLSIIYGRAGNKDIFITVTHRHGDHLGMLPAFKSDPRFHFWIPEAEFRGIDIFPKERIVFFAENESLKLGGGFVVNTMEVPGHTTHSTLFFLKGKNLVFTGDAIGSGSGVWLFDYDSFITYRKGVERLIKYVEDPANKIDPKKLVIYGGHFWQGAKPGTLTTQYIYDMRNLIDRIGKGIAETESMSSSMKYLDTNFKFGTATITWNKEAALKYSESMRGK